MVALVAIFFKSFSARSFSRQIVGIVGNYGLSFPLYIVMQITPAVYGIIMSGGRKYGQILYER